MQFQQQVNITPALGQPGDFATNNPYSVFPGEAGQYIAGAGGVAVGLFGWLQADGRSILNSGQGVPTGFMHRNLQAQIVTYLTEYGVTIQAGQVAVPYVRGDYFAVSTVAAAVVGNKAFASYLTGAMQPGVTGVEPGTIAITASTATNVLTVTVTAGVLAVGQLITGAGIPANTYIASQTSGTPGSTGTYTLTTTPGTVASEAMVAHTWIETPYVIASSCNIGELAIISL